MPPESTPQPVFLTTEWRHLVMLNYETDPAALAPLVPRGTELDLWDGKALVSIVGLLFLGTKVMGIPVPFHRNFEEVNLRFYVNRPLESGPRRGVVFVKEIVPRWAIALVARALYNENYVALPMEHCTRAAQGAEGLVEYRWRVGSHWNLLRAEFAGPPHRPPDGSEAQFITEHYWGYAAQRDGGCVEYQVEHPAWEVWPADHAELDCDAEALYGLQFAKALASPPTSAFVAAGSPVIVRRGTRIS